ncbi:MAG: response regulator [Synergistales bacterium]|nr:response regulator [Synergistales bacterium]
MAQSIQTFVIADDEAILVMDLRMKLQQRGYEVVASVHRGDRVVETVREHSPDCLLLDVRLQGEQTGTEVARELRGFTDIPIVFITGYSSADIEEEVRAIANTALLHKPFSPPELDRAIETLTGEG